MDSDTKREITIAYHSSTRAAAELVRAISVDTPFRSEKEVVESLRKIRNMLMDDCKEFHNGLHGKKDNPVPEAQVEKPAEKPAETPVETPVDTVDKEQPKAEPSDEKILALAERSIVSASNIEALRSVKTKIDNASKLSTSDKEMLMDKIRARKEEIENHGK